MLVACKVCNKAFLMKHRGDVHHLIPQVCSGKCFSVLLKQCPPDIFVNDGRAVRFEEQDWSTRSSYEAKLVGYMSQHGLIYRYEPLKFTLSDGSCYVPDFTLWNHAMVIEVKGDWRPGAKKKVKLFSREFKVKYYLVDWEVLTIITRRV